LDSPPAPTLDLSAEAKDWVQFVNHSEAVQASEPTDTAFDRFREHRHEFVAVLDGVRPVGVCARREVGMLLGGRYGYALYARKPVRAHMSPDMLCVSVEMPVDEVLAAVAAREAAAFYDDVVLVDKAGAFLGLIPVHALVRLQAALREKHVRELQIQRQEIAEKNAQMEADLALAREMQLALLPQQFPVFPADAHVDGSHLRFSHLYLPTTAVSGDFFHVLPLDERRAGVFICDVMGHGVRSALITAMVRVLVQDACPNAPDAAALLARVNRGLMEIIPHDAGMMFVTASYAIFDVERRTVQYASAGHPPPLHLMRGTCAVEPLPIPRGDFNPALAIFPGAAFHAYEQTLEEGDVVLFYTDGIFEVDDAAGEQLGMEGLTACVKSCAAAPLAKLVPGILAAVQAGAAHGFDDDVCLLAAELGTARQT
jgi:serine phosphatase RsbU (regulator of sigma subunit)